MIHQCVSPPSGGRETGRPVGRHELMDVKDPTEGKTRWFVQHLLSVFVHKVNLPHTHIYTHTHTVYTSTNEPIARLRSFVRFELLEGEVEIVNNNNDLILSVSHLVVGVMNRSVEYERKILNGF